MANMIFSDWMEVLRQEEADGHSAFEQEFAKETTWNEQVALMSLSNHRPILATAGPSKTIRIFHSCFSREERLFGGVPG